VREIVRLPRARRDLIDIWLYTAEQWDEEQADRYLRHLDDAIRQLAENPFLGSDCSHVRKGHRRVPAGRHRIFYRFDKDRVEIVRVLHASMDFPAHL
jgi:toxin ParE1/3/4